MSAIAHEYRSTVVAIVGITLVAIVVQIRAAAATSEL